MTLKTILKSAWLLGLLFWPAAPAVRAATLDQDVSRVYAYPVPFRHSRGDEKITFAFLPASGTVSVYTLTGELLRKINFLNPVDGKLEWDVTNENGEKLGTDIFVYIVESGGSRKTGKIVVVR